MFRNVLYLIEIYNFHVESFLWIILHHGENLAQSCEKIRNFLYFEKFLSWEISTFQTKILNSWFLGEQVSCFDIFWWKMTLGTWFWPKKSKFDFSVYSWLLISWLKINYQSNWSWEMFWVMLLGKNDAIKLLRSYLKPIFHWLGKKSKIDLVQSKP